VSEQPAHTVVMLTHARLQLALHTLRNGTGPRLLLLHGLGERAPDVLTAEIADAWPGPVHALDFSGHGGSSCSLAGGYSCEFFLADVDAALHHLGACTLLGRGLGGYVAVLAAGARPLLVRGVVVADGPGLAGGGPRPGSSRISAPEVRTSSGTPDPYVFLELGSDVRPPDYVSGFVALAAKESGLDQPITVAAASRPPWLAAIMQEYGVGKGTVSAGLRRYATLT
jgi:pimeloyl-ACP methyl ester carboxylesterase